MATPPILTLDSMAQNAHSWASIWNNKNWHKKKYSLVILISSIKKNRGLFKIRNQESSRPEVSVFTSSSYIWNTKQFFFISFTQWVFGKSALMAMMTRLYESPEQYSWAVTGGRLWCQSGLGYNPGSDTYWQSSSSF